MDQVENNKGPVQPYCVGKQQSSSLFSSHLIPSLPPPLARSLAPPHSCSLALTSSFSPALARTNTLPSPFPCRAHLLIPISNFYPRQANQFRAV